MADREDRTVHALTADGAEVVRYERAGKWYVEVPVGQRQSRGGRTRISIDEAVALARDGEAKLGLYGGARFDRKVIAARKAARR